MAPSNSRRLVLLWARTLDQGRPASLPSRSLARESRARMPKYFTRAEAEALLPRLRPLLLELRAARTELHQAEERSDEILLKPRGNAHEYQGVSGELRRRT